MSSANGAGLPRVLFLGRNHYRLPLPGWLAKKWLALERTLDYRVVAAAERGSPLADGRFRLLAPARIRQLDGALFYLRFPLHARRNIRDFRPEAIIAGDPYVGAAALIGRAFLRGPKPQVIVEVHGDWRTATRLYGSPRRTLLSPVADLIARLALRRADAVRAVSPYTGGLVEEIRGIPVTATFPTYTDLLVFSSRSPVPLPAEPVALFVGMLEYYKNIDGLAAAWRSVARELPSAKLVVVGKGARRELVEQLIHELPDQVQWFEELPPEDVARKLDEASILVLPSRSEGLPRVLVEAFARGRGAIGGRAGGIPELVHEGVTGLLVDPEDVPGLAHALRTALSDRSLAERFGSAAHELYSSVHTTPSEYASRVRGLVETCLRESGAVPGMKPRVLLVGRRTYRLSADAPTDVTLRALREEVDLCVVGRAPAGTRPRKSAVGPGSLQLIPRRAGPLDAPVFYATLPLRLARLIRRFQPGVVIAESPYIGFLVLLAFGLSRRRPSLVVETHGDWRAATRLGNSRMLLLLAPFADWAARYALRRADALRALSRFTADLAEREAGVPPLESFPTYTDLSAFTAAPPAPFPDTPTALFVGMLEAYKNVDGLAEAWRRVAEVLPEARLVIVGRGALIDVVDRLRDDYPDRIDHFPELAPNEVSSRMDDSTCLVLPSRSEGLGRVLIESFARGRGVVGAAVGGIPDVVQDGVQGLLIDPGNVDELAAALVRVLSDQALAARFGAAARESYASWHSTPDEYAARVRSLVDRTLAASARPRQ